MNILLIGDYGEMVPLGDISDFDDIANAVWFLGTEASKNISGTELVIDGAMSVQFYPQLLNELKKIVSDVHSEKVINYISNSNLSNPDKENLLNLMVQ